VTGMGPPGGLATGEAIQVLIQNSGDEIRYSQGTPVNVHLPPEALRVLQDTGERHQQEKDPPAAGSAGS
jgi:hypothetical protein